MHVSFIPVLSQRCRKPLGPKGRRFGKPLPRVAEASGQSRRNSHVNMLERMRRKRLTSRRLSKRRAVTLRTSEAIRSGFRYNANSEPAVGDIKAILRRHMNRRLYFALSKVKRSPSVVLRVAKNELAVRPAIVRSEKPNTGPKDWFSGIDDETWLWMNTTGR